MAYCEAGRDIEAPVIHSSSVAVSREHRRAKTDRLDTGLLKHSFLGWLRGDANHNAMAVIPTLEEEDDKRANREHQTLVGERTRLINGMKGAMARLGIRNFKPTLRNAAERLPSLRTPNSEPIPPKIQAELRRDLARLQLIKGQIKEIETVRDQQMTEAPDHGTHPMMHLLAKIMGIVSRLRICLCMKCYRATCVTAGR